MTKMMIVLSMAAVVLAVHHFTKALIRLLGRMAITNTDTGLAENVMPTTLIGIAEMIDLPFIGHINISKHKTPVYL